MTISYTSEVVTSKGYGVFLRLLLRWRGGIYKLIWKDLLIFLVLFYAINLTYRFVLEGTSRTQFEKVVTYCNEYYSLIPLSFVLGFYVTIVMNRWWEQYTFLPYPDNLALLLSASMQSQDDRGKLMRRTIVRYICLAFAITMTLISPKAKKRFPTVDHFVEAGMMMKDEKRIFESMESEYPKYAKYWLPLAWAGNLITRARHEGLIASDTSVRAIMEELNTFRSKCGTLLDYDWISIPLVYTQVVTLAVYTYFLTTILAQQPIDPNKDLYFPFLTVLEFFFYMGWLKVAETLINPFGEDDDDFEVNWLIDRHVLVTYLLVDKMHQEHPKLMKDQYWQKMAPQQLPYTVATEECMQECQVHSTDKIVLKKEETDIITQTRRDTKDGKLKRQGSWIKRAFKKNPRLSRKEVSHNNSVSEQDEVIEMDDAGSPGICCAQDSPQKNIQADDVDFQKLKDIRQSLMKRKIKKWISLMRKSNLKENEENDLINDIINTPDGKSDYT